MNRELLKLLCLFAIAAALICAASTRAISANLSVTPSLSLSQAYDSNIFNSTTNPQSDYIFRAYPSLTLSLSALETSLNLTGELLFNYYFNHKELNNTQQALTKNLDLSLGKNLGRAVPLQVTPTFFITPAVYFFTTYDYGYRSATLKSSQPGLPPTNTYVTDQNGGASADAGGSITFDYSVTPRLSASLTGAVARRLFDTYTPNTIDSWIYSGTAGVGYKVTPLFGAWAFFRGTLDRYENGNETRDYTAGLGGSYTITENYSSRIEAGATKYQNISDNTISENQRWSPYFNGSLYYIWKQLTADLTASYEIAGGGSFGTTTRQGSITFDIIDQFAEHWSWELRGNYQRNRNTTTTVSTPSEYTTAIGAARIQYSPYRWASISLLGTNLRQWSNANAGGDMRRHVIMLGVSVGNVYSIAGNPAEVPDLYLRY